MLMASCTLLYVEDNEEAQERMKMILQGSVNKFYQAYNGEEGIALYKEKKPDIVLSDINMPIMDGLSMSQIIKDLDREQIIIIISAFDDKDSLLQAINMGVDYFLPKPIDIEVLEDRLNFFTAHLRNKKEVEAIGKKEQEDLYNLAHFDALTNIPNRLLFNSKLEQAMSKARRKSSLVTLFFIDLDNFKNINDTYGHIAGDSILMFITSNVTRVIRVEDTFSRISGDEFSLIIEDSVDRDYLDVLAQKILNAVSLPMPFNGNMISISCSIGISSFPKESHTLEELIHSADVAMYKAKELGKSTYIYFEDLKES